MKQLRFIAIIIFLIVFLIVFTIVKRTEVVLPTQNINFRNQIEGWSYKKSFDMEKSVLDTLEPKLLLYDEYSNDDGIPIQLVVVYHKNKRWGAHNPQVCYKSQGWEFVEKTKVIRIMVDSQPFLINQFIIRKGDQLNLVYYYWFSSNKKITHSRNQQMWDMVINGIMHGYTESGFVRISIPIRSIDDTTRVRQINSFTDKFTSKLIAN